MRTVAIIDGDIFAFRASSAVQRDIEWAPDDWMTFAYTSDAVSSFKETMYQISKKLRIDEYVFTFSSQENFRKDILQSYKENRRGSRKPCCYLGMVQWLKDNYESYSFDRLEGDDVMGILMTDPEFKVGRQKVMLTMDKDLKTIEGKLYDFKRDTFTVQDQDQAYYWHMMQTLTGDVTDGYKGCPRVGKVLAEKILNGPDVSNKNPPSSYWSSVVNAYEKQGLTESDALVQARVAYILKNKDYNRDTGEITLWSPPNFN